MNGQNYQIGILVSSIILYTMLVIANFLVYPSSEDIDISSFLYNLGKNDDIGVNSLKIIKSDYSCPLGYNTVNLGQFPSFKNSYSCKNLTDNNFFQVLEDKFNKSRAYYKEFNCTHNSFPSNKYFYYWKGVKFCSITTHLANASISKVSLNLSDPGFEPITKSVLPFSIFTEKEKDQGYFVSGIFANIGPKCVNPYEKGYVLSNYSFVVNNAKNYNNCSSYYFGEKEGSLYKKLDSYNSNSFLSENLGENVFGYKPFEGTEVNLYATYLPTCLKKNVEIHDHFHITINTAENIRIAFVVSLLCTLFLLLFSLFVIGRNAGLMNLNYYKRLKLIFTLFLCFSLLTFVISFVNFIYIKRLFPLIEYRKMTDPNFECYDKGINSLLFFSNYSFINYNFLGMLNTTLSLCTLCSSFIGVLVRKNGITMDCSNWAILS